MPKEQDPFRKYVKDLGKRKWRCTFCNKEFAGSTPRIRAHLAGIPGHGIKACEKVKDSVRAEALETFNGKGSVLDKSTGGTSGEGTSQSVLPSDDASDPNDTQNSGQLGYVPQQPSFHQPTGSGTAPACPQDQGSLPPGDRPLDNLDNTQQSDPSNHRLDAAHGNENALSLRQHPMDSSALPSLDLGELLKPLEQSTHLGFRDVITPDVPLHSPQANLHDFPLENFREFFAEVFKEIEANELHDPAVVSSLQIDPSLDVDRANRLQDCGQPRRVEVVPVPSNRSPTNIVQHPGQLPPRCDKEDGNDIRQFPSPTQMEIDPSSASLHTSGSHILEATIVDSPVVEASTDTVVPSSSHTLVPLSSSRALHNAPPAPRILPYGTGVIGPSSLPDLYKGAPMTSHPNTRNNFEENRALKRKLELLYSKEADVRDELKFAASLFLKKPRKEVAKWLADVEKLRIDCRLPPYQQVDILMREAEDLSRQGEGLFEVREVTKLLEDKMVGEEFWKNTAKILEYLVGNKIHRLGIYGMGGVGKTTILVHIHNRLLEKANYGKVLWITVSRDFDTQSLQDAIWKEVGSGILQENDVKKRAAMLWDCLMKRGKCTIILDDVWEHFDLKEVGIPVGAYGIKLVLTTRSFEVCRQMQCQEMIKIEPLSHIEAESLFFEELGSEVALNLQTNAVVKSIVKECAGLPLAVITMARSMRGVTNAFEWNDCLEKLRESDMGQMDMGKKVLKTLEFSYSRLGDCEVQECFLSCALYSKGEFIDKFELIEFFIDQGLIDQPDTREKQYTRGLTILNKLENVCLLEDHGSKMKMHDLIRDMALHIMSTTSIVKARKGLRTIPNEKYWTDALEKVSLRENIIREFPLNMSPNCPKLSIFLMNENCCYDVAIPDSFFKQLRGLKVLNLSECGVREFPDSISDLVNLRALLLRKCTNLRRIPDLGKLRSLRKFDIFHCDKVEALKGLEKLVDLRYLDISCTSMKRSPEGTLGALLNLQYLTFFLEDVDNFNEFARVVSNHRLDSSHGTEIASSLQQLTRDWSALFSLDLSELSWFHLEFGGDVLPTPLLSNITMTSIPQFSNEQYLSFDEQFVDGITRDTLLYPTENFDMEENFLKSCEDGANASEEIETDELHNPTPLDIDPSTASQQLEALTNTIGQSSAHASAPPQLQIDPHGCIYLTIMHQNPTLASSLSKKQLVICHPQALMDKDSCMPSSSQATNNAPPPPQILPCGTGLIGPSSIPELDMNEGAPMTSHPNTRNNFEENGALKRKLELLYSKEADVRDELKFAASLFLKKPRKEVAKWLADVEKLRIDCPEAASEDCLPSYQQVNTLMRKAEDLSRQGKGLFEVREVSLLEDKMVGEAFQRNTTKILEYLVGNQVSRLGIYGTGGVGKTTILVHIYNRLLKKANYGKVLWITVSEDFNTQSLQDAVWKEVGSGILQENDVRKRAAILWDCLTKRGKTTIILDDVWEHFDLKEVGIPVRADEIKLVFITRSLEVCHLMECQELIKIEPLSYTEAKGLFLEELGFKLPLNLETKAVVNSIVKECAGLPLPVITIARSMREVTDVFEWMNYMERLRESNMWQRDMEKKVLELLKFSYDLLGDCDIQQCFLSCALYPKGSLINKFDLIGFFIDQGLIGRLNTMEKQYQRGLTILNKLANVCLLEDHGEGMRMHNLITDMALRMMSVTSIVTVKKSLASIPSEEYWTDALEKVSLMENNIEEFPLNMSPNCPKLSTLLLNGNMFNRVVIPTIPNSFFKQLCGLKVLNLSGCKLRELPNSISDLVNLRALLLGCCWELRHIPYLGKLASLRKLDVFCCAKLEAIKGLEMLVELRYLDIGCTRIKRVPDGTLGALQKLQYLRVQAANEEDIIKLCALEALKCEFEDVDDFNRLVRVVNKQSNNPRYYRLHMCQKRWKLYVDLNEGGPFGNFERSVHIEMETTSYTIVSAGGESSGSGSGSGICILIPQNVQTLSARNCDGATNLSDMGLPGNLEELTIDEWKNLRVLSGRQDEEIINIHDSPTPTPAPLLFLSLGVLSIHSCLRLKYLFGHGPKFYLPHLREINIVGCKEMVGITVAVTSPSLHLSPAFPSLEHIHVWECDKMKRVVESEWLSHFCNLRRIQVRFCENVEEIIGGPPPYMPVEEISLEELSIEDCANLRKLFSHELLIHLRNLQSIAVQNCKGIVEIISRARRGQEGSITTPVNNISSSFSSSQSSISLPKLKYLWLRNLPQLKSICEVPITCDSMEDLEVDKCPELNKIPLQLQLRDTENLPYIKVEGEEKWKTLIWDHPNAQAILQSHLLFCGSLCILESRNSLASAKKK